MNHMGKKYNGVIDTTGRIPEDEPVFLLRGKDKLTPQVIGFWAQLLLMNGGERHLVDAAMAWKDQIMAYQEQNGNQLPDCPPHDLNKENLGYMQYDKPIEGSFIAPARDAVLNDVKNKIGAILENSGHPVYKQPDGKYAPITAQSIDHQTDAAIDEINKHNEVTRETARMLIEQQPGTEEFSGEVKAEIPVDDTQESVMVTLTLHMSAATAKTVMGSGREIKITL